MKKIFKPFNLAAVAMSCMLLAACGTSEGTSGTDKPIVVGTEATFAPFEYMDKGEIVGFDVDLLDAVLSEAGIEYELKNVGWDPIFIMIENGEIDMAVSGITITEDRQQTYDFSSPYFESTHMVAFKEGADITSANDIVGKNIGVQISTTGQIAAEKIVGENHSDISKFDSTALAFLALDQGNVDVVVTDNVVVNEYVKNNPNSGVTGIEDTENFEAEYYGFLFKKENDLREEVNAAFKTILENGTYSEIYEEWFGVQPNIDLLLEFME
ncbi:basic amino acid ABC transporter substrate-binding protein [Alkalihalobacillus sp. LMS39]|uniref:basic amino acid ABC transporter substrate-binding protein n=1 Tax=Alkalihalobacillus sp. LMS39 TaxID=2924032 RepID=UPI001FB32596|nr:basic amino acid ABC transporter substrate-binding protein [Alkalihalobacillus sp. LMS39]UOE94886.1 basic amino acid ABC transporter substrate-binding protein [Alkalihalobacillus sp. LMS39]